MTVRNTESRLPDGLEAKDLGQAVENGDFKLISYLTQPLRYEEGKKALTNTYVVFDTGGTSNPSDYRWKFEFEIEGQDDAIELSDLEGVEGGAVFNLNSEEGDFEDALEGKIVTKITTTVALDVNATNVLIMEQTVDGLDEDIEALIANFDNEKGANAGEPKTTRRIANEYKDYLIALGKDKGEAELAKVSLNLLATLLYQAIESDAGFFSRASDYLFNPDEEDWMNYANGKGGVEFNDLVGTKISILDVKPHVFYFLHQPPGAGTPYQDYVYDEDQESLDSFEEEILSNLNSLSSTEKIDLVNRLRFPKSCLYSVWTYLKHLKERHNDYLSKVLDKDNHSTNRECISTVVTEFETAPQNNLDGPSSTAVQAYDVMYSKWMQAILKTSKIQMEIVKIKVLDIRSGKPIKNSRVRKLIVYGTQSAVIKKFGTNGEVDLLYERDRIVENDPLRAAQIALLRLGYAPAPVDREDANEETPGGWCDGAWDGQTSQAYNQYWQDRILSTDMNAGAAAADQPSARDLKAIKTDYNGHAYTDDSGVIEVRIPKVFMDGRSINIDIQFWEIPIVREEIEDDSGDPITRPSTDEAATDFVVSWVGGTGANQKVNWTDYVVNNQIVEASDFGWEVSKDDRNSKLKAVQRLIVKDDEDDFDGYDTSLLSKFYDSDSYPIHFVLFGMVWCQPVWDEYEDADSGVAGAITENAYIQNPMYKNLHMHLATMPYDFRKADPNVCTDIYGGKGYARYETDFGNSSRWRNIDPPTPGHKGYDLHANLGDNVFVFHGGKAENIDSGAHIMCKITWSGTLGHKRVDYLHLSAHVACAAVDEVNVIAGQVAAETGRTGNCVDKTPSHVHLNVGTTNDLAHKYLPRLTETLRNHYPENEKCIPNNDFPLAFPCACEVVNPDPENCNFSNLNFLRDCWAAAELKCPYINPNDKGNIKLQVQLRHIKQITNADPGGFTDKVNNNPEYFSPGTIDGVIPNAPSNVNTPDLVNGTVIVRLAGSEHGGRLIKIRHKIDKEGWIESSLIDDDNKLVIPPWLGVNSLNNLIDNSVGPSRMAIYFFRKANRILDFTDYASNFSMDDPAWQTLNNIAPITTPE